MAVSPDFIVNFNFLSMPTPCFGGAKNAVPDQSVCVLNSILGNVVDQIAGGAALPSGGQAIDLIPNVLQTFNTLLLGSGLILFALMLFVGTMQTSYEGTFLGRNWSSIWTPLRLIIGLLFVVPLKGGLCFGQHVILYGILIGVHLASQVWYQAVDDVKQGVTPEVPSYLNQMALQSLNETFLLGSVQKVLGHYLSNSTGGTTVSGYTTNQKILVAPQNNAQAPNALPQSALAQILYAYDYLCQGLLPSQVANCQQAAANYLAGNGSGGASDSAANFNFYLGIPPESMLNTVAAPAGYAPSSIPYYVWPTAAPNREVALDQAVYNFNWNNSGSTAAKSQLQNVSVQKDSTNSLTPLVDSPAGTKHVGDSAETASVMMQTYIENILNTTVMQSSVAPLKACQAPTKSSKNSASDEGKTYCFDTLVPQLDQNAVAYAQAQAETAANNPDPISGLTPNEMLDSLGTSWWYAGQSYLTLNSVLSNNLHFMAEYLGLQAGSGASVISNNVSASATYNTVVGISETPNAMSAKYMSPSPGCVPYINNSTSDNPSAPFCSYTPATNTPFITSSQWVSGNKNAQNGGQANCVPGSDNCYVLTCNANGQGDSAGLNTYTYKYLYKFGWNRWPDPNQSGQAPMGLGTYPNWDSNLFFVCNGGSVYTSALTPIAFTLAQGGMEVAPTAGNWSNFLTEVAAAQAVINKDPTNNCANIASTDLTSENLYCRLSNLPVDYQQVFYMIYQFLGTQTLATKVSSKALTPFESLLVYGNASGESGTSDIPLYNVLLNMLNVVAANNQNLSSTNSSTLPIGQVINKIFTGLTGNNDGAMAESALSVMQEVYQLGLPPDPSNTFSVVGAQFNMIQQVQAVGMSMIMTAVNSVSAVYQNFQKQNDELRNTIENEVNQETNTLSGLYGAAIGSSSVGSLLSTAFPFLGGTLNAASSFLMGAAQITEAQTQILIQEQTVNQLSHIANEMIWLPMLMVVMTSLFSAGLSFLLLVPIMPYILFWAGQIAWVLAVIEAMVAAPLVMLAIAHPGGHQVFGHTIPAVKMFVGVVFRPVLMIIGMLVGIVLTYLIIPFSAQGFHMVASDIITAAQSASAQGASTTGAGVLSCVMLFVYCAFIVLAFNKCFSAIYAIPDKVMNWIGGQGEKAGAEELQQMTGKVDQTGQAAGKAGSDSAGQGISTMKDISKQKSELGRSELSASQSELKAGVQMAETPGREMDKYNNKKQQGDAGNNPEGSIER